MKELDGINPCRCGNVPNLDVNFSLNPMVNDQPVWKIECSWGENLGWVSNARALILIWNGLNPKKENKNGS